MATGRESIGPENSTSSQDVITNNIVLNLSKYILSPAELSVLNKGLPFCPTSSQIDYSEIMEGVENTLRQMRCTVFFQRLSDLKDSIDNLPSISGLSQSSSQSDSKPFDHYKFREASSFDPKLNKNQTVLNSFCKSVLHDVDTSPIHPFRRHNLTKDEHSAVEALSSNPEIIIKPADKGGKIVIQDTTTYISEAQRQLSDLCAYRQLASDPTHVNNTQVHRLIDELEECGSLSTKVAYFLVFDKPKTPQLYLLPKINILNHSL